MDTKTKSIIISYGLIALSITLIIWGRLPFIVGVLVGCLSVIHMFYKRNALILWIVRMQDGDPYLEEITRGNNGTKKN